MQPSWAIFSITPTPPPFPGPKYLYKKRFPSLRTGQIERAWAALLIRLETSWRHGDAGWIGLNGVAVDIPDEQFAEADIKVKALERLACKTTGDRQRLISLLIPVRQVCALISFFFYLLWTGMWLYSINSPFLVLKFLKRAFCLVFVLCILTSLHTGFKIWLQALIKPSKTHFYSWTFLFRYFTQWGILHLFPVFFDFICILRLWHNK